MKKITFLLLTLITFALYATCAGASGSKAGSLSETDLLHKTFTLIKVDGKALSLKEGRTPELVFLEGMRVSGVVCNSFSGMGTFRADTLTVENMASTMMLCVDPERNALERRVTETLRNGVRLMLDGDTLTLSTDGGTLEYVRKQ